MNLARILGEKLSENTFLQYVFHPKKAVRPTGVRRHKITWIGKGRKARRIRAYNKMDPLKQRIIEAVGRERYLRGEITLAEAKQELRPVAIERGIAKPVKPRGIAPIDRAKAEADAIANILRVAEQRDPYRENGDEKSPISPRTVLSNVKTLMRPQDVIEAREITYRELKKRAESTLNLRVNMDTGEIHNPWWYH